MRRAPRTAERRTTTRRTRVVLGLAGLLLVLSAPAAAGANPTSPDAPASPGTETSSAAPVSPVAPSQPSDRCTWAEFHELIKWGDETVVSMLLLVECPDGVEKPQGQDDYPPLDAAHQHCELTLVSSRQPGGLLVPGANCGTKPFDEVFDSHPCRWDFQYGDDSKRSVRLVCDPSVKVPSSRDLMPDPPRGCRWDGGSRPTCADAGMQLVDCRNEINWWFDDDETMNVPESAPAWWLEEIAEESRIDGGRGCKLAEHPPYLACADRDLTAYTPPGLLPDGCWGTYPTANYELSWDDGAWSDVSKYGERLMGWVASFMFIIGRSAIQVVLWLVQWGYEFDITDYTDMFASVGGRYQERIVGPWGLDDLVWMVLVGYAGFTTLRRRFGTAGGELLLSFVMLGLATVLFDNRGMYMDAAAEAMTAGSDDLLIAASDNAVGDDVTDQRSQVIRPLQQEIHSQFVEEPYMYLNWGTSNLSDECRAIVLNIAATGWDGDGWPARYLGRDGNPEDCRRIAGFNKEMNGTRLASALLTMVVSVVAATMLGLAAITVLLAKFMVGVLFAMTPFIVVVAVLPGAGRRLAWNWLGMLVQAFAAAWGMSLVIAVMLLAIKEFLTSTERMEIYERWTLVLLTVGLAYVGRKSLLAGTKTLAGGVADAMTRLAPASAGWSSRGPRGIDFGAVERGVSRAAVAPAQVAVREWSKRAAERRSARRSGRRSLANMRYMERQRNRPALEHRVDAYQYDRRAPAGTPATIDYTGSTPGGRGGLLGLGRSTPGTPARFSYRGPTGGGVQDGEQRERWELIAKVHAPPPFLRHPVRHVQDRVYNRHTLRMARRSARDVSQTSYTPDYFVDRGLPHVKDRPATAPPPAPRPGPAWVPRPFRGGGGRRVPRGWR